MKSIQHAAANNAKPPTSYYISMRMHHAMYMQGSRTILWSSLHPSLYMSARTKHRLPDLRGKHLYLISELTCGLILFNVCMMCIYLFVLGYRHTCEGQVITSHLSLSRVSSFPLLCTQRYVA